MYCCCTVLYSSFGDGSKLANAYRSGSGKLLTECRETRERKRERCSIVCCCHQKCERKRGAEREKRLELSSRGYTEGAVAAWRWCTLLKQRWACFLPLLLCSRFLRRSIGSRLAEERREEKVVVAERLFDRTVAAAAATANVVHLPRRLCWLTGTGWKTRVNCCSRRREKKTALDGRRNTRRATRSESAAAAVRQPCYSHTHTHLIISVDRCRRRRSSCSHRERVK